MFSLCFFKNITTEPQRHRDTESTEKVELGSKAMISFQRKHTKKTQRRKERKRVVLLRCNRTNCSRHFFEEANDGACRPGCLRQ